MGCGPSRTGDSSEALLAAKEALLSEPPQTDFLRNLRLVATVLAVSLGSSLQFGFATGSLNNLEQIIPDALATYGNPIDIAQWALINSSFSVGGLLGSYGSFISLAHCGRRKTLLMANIFVFLSSVRDVHMRARLASTAARSRNCSNLFPPAGPPQAPVPLSAPSATRPSPQHPNPDPTPTPAFCFFSAFCF